MAAKQHYPTGPVKHLFKQITGLQRLKEAKRDLFRELTDREIEVLTLIANGMKNPAIAKELDISRATVQNHRASVRDKLNLNNQTDYIKYAMAYELIQF